MDEHIGFEKWVLGVGPFGCINWSVMPRPKCLMTHCPWVNIQSLTMVVFSWSFPKIISMCHTRPRHCFNEDKTDVPILFLINLWWPLFFFYYWVPFVTYCWLFPQSQALVFLVTWLKAEAAWSFLLFLFLFLFVNEWSFFLKEHDLCTWFLHIEVHHSHGTWFSTC